MSDTDEYSIDEENDRDGAMTDMLLHASPIQATPIGGRNEGDHDSVGEVQSYDITESPERDSVYTEFNTSGDGIEIRKKLYDATKQLMREGEKNVSLALELEKYKDELTILRKETDAFRSVLLRGINGGVADSANYENIGLDELLRLRIQESASSMQSSNSTDKSSLQYSLAKNESSVGVIQKLEHKLGMETQQNEALEAKCQSLKDELEASAKHMEGVENLRVKVSQMVERLRTEREHKFKVQKDLSIEKNKVEALSDHIEKLMVHLKHEAIAKARSLGDQSRLQREMEMMKAKSSAVTRKNERKDQVIAELREGGRLLEHQLRLMDEKYMELRSKLDWTRSQTEKIIRKKDEEVRLIRSNTQALLDVGGEASSARKPSKSPKAITRSRADGEGRRSVIELHKALNAAKQSSKSQR